MARRFVINGRFLTQPVTGVQRYGREFLSALARILKRDTSVSTRFQFEILTPPVAMPDDHLSPISIRRVGRWTGQLWEQWELPRFAAGATILNCANTAPIGYRNQIVTIHDASVFAAPDGYSLSFRLWYRTLHRRIAKCAKGVVTDSEFSRAELERYCGFDPVKCRVIPLGAEHILDTLPDSSILNRLNVSSKKFVLCAGSLNPNKNLAALVETANRLRERAYPMVVAGGGNERIFKGASIAFPENVRYAGYVSDGELRALYESAACFVFPSRYEGFGLPPLEAMACGCPVVSSNAASLGEVCGDAALMCDPGRPDEFAQAVLSVIGDQSKSTELSAKGRTEAAKFRWEQTAMLWLALLDSI